MMFKSPLSANLYQITEDKKYLNLSQSQIAAKALDLGLELSLMKC
jgi:hypothetical protein